MNGHDEAVKSMKIHLKYKTFVLLHIFQSHSVDQIEVFDTLILVPRPYV